MERLSTAVYARGPCFIRNSNDVDKDLIEWGVSKTGRTCRALCPGLRKYLELGCARAKHFILTMKNLLVNYSKVSLKFEEWRPTMQT